MAEAPKRVVIIGDEPQPLAEGACRGLAGQVGGELWVRHASSAKPSFKDEHRQKEIDALSPKLQGKIAALAGEQVANGQP